MEDFETILDFEDGDLDEEEDHNWWAFCDCGDCDDCDLYNWHP
jgi:hypothetical protein